MNIETFLSAPWTGTVRACAFAAIALLSASCAHFAPPDVAAEPEPAREVVEEKPKPEPVTPPPPSPLYEWHGSDGYVSRIVISVDEQKARFYDGEREVGWTTVASGLKSYPTPIGEFAVIEKVQNKRSNLYGRIYNKNGKLVKSNAKAGVHQVPAGGSFKGASMPYFLRLTNDGIGMHAGPIPRPGSRASHGCIRMPQKFAPILFNHVDIGTPVVIEGTGPSYASYLAKQRRSRPKARPTEVAQVATSAPSATGSRPRPTTADDQTSAPVSTAGNATEVDAAPATTLAASSPAEAASEATDAAGARIQSPEGTADRSPNEADGGAEATAAVEGSAPTPAPGASPGTSQGRVPALVPASMQTSLPPDGPPRPAVDGQSEAATSAIPSTRVEPAAPIGPLPKTENPAPPGTSAPGNSGTGASAPGIGPDPTATGEPTARSPAAAEPAAQAPTTQVPKTQSEPPKTDASPGSSAPAAPATGGGIGNPAGNAAGGTDDPVAVAPQ